MLRKGFTIIELILISLIALLIVFALNASDSEKLRRDRAAAQQASNVGNEFQLSEYDKFIKISICPSASDGNVSCLVFKKFFGELNIIRVFRFDVEYKNLEIYCDVSDVSYGRNWIGSRGDIRTIHVHDFSEVGTGN